MHSFEIWLATIVVFWGSGNVGYTLLEYRLGHKELVNEGQLLQTLLLTVTQISGFLENVMWMPFL